MLLQNKMSKEVVTVYMDGKRGVKLAYCHFLLIMTLKLEQKPIEVHVYFGSDILIIIKIDIINEIIIDLQRCL